MAQDDTTRSQRRNRRQFIKAAGMTLSTTLLHPESRGRITLTSSDPFDELLIDPNHLDEQPELLRNFSKRPNLALDYNEGSYHRTIHKVSISTQLREPSGRLSLRTGHSMVVAT